MNQVISKANEAYSPLCPGAGGAGIYIDWCIKAQYKHKTKLPLDMVSKHVILFAQHPDYMYSLIEADVAIVLQDRSVD